MLNLILIGLIGSSLAATILPAQTITLEDGTTIWVSAVDDTQLANMEGTIGCSVKCASACLTFSKGTAANQCVSHCGCSSLTSTTDPTVAALASTTTLMQSDISIDVILPRSDTDTLDIYIVEDGDQTEISVDHEDTSTSDYDSQTVGVTVNTDDGSWTEDEATASASIYSDDSSTYDSFEYSDTDGDYASLGYTQNVTTDGDSTIDSQHVEASNGDENAYVDTTTTTTPGDEDSVEQNTVTTGNVAGYGFNDTKDTEVNITETGGSGTSEETFSWWVSTQQFVQGTFEGMGMAIWAVLALTIAAVGYLAYRKATQIKAKRYQVNVKAVDEDAVDYIRI